MDTNRNITSYLVLLALMLMAFKPHAQTKKTMQNNFIFLNEKGIPIPADTLLKNFSFYYVQNRAVAGMVAVPPPVKAIASILYYYTKNNEKKPFQNVISIRLETDTPFTFNGILIKNIQNLGSLSINDYQYKDSAGFTISRAVLRNNKQQISGLYTDILTFDHSFVPDYYLLKDTLYERSTFAQELRPIEVTEWIKQKQLRCDTLCGGIKSPLYPTTVLWLHNKTTTNDSIFLIVEGFFSKKTDFKTTTHSVRYLPPDALDMEAALTITFTDCGSKKKKRSVIIALPPLSFTGNYSVNIGCETQKAPRKYIAIPQGSFCPMMITVL